jgi:anaerobic selenocysteine-containing dehydrogenase
LSEVAIVSRLARAVFGDSHAVPWAGFEDDYDTVRDHISRVVPGCVDYNSRVREPDGFVLPHPPRDSRSFPTTTGKANFTVNPVQLITVPAGRLILQTLRSHDQYNTTIYGLDDRYRGVHDGRRVVFVNPEDLATLGISDGAMVDMISEWPSDSGVVERRVKLFRVIAYPTARGCAAAYFPEANALVPLESTAETSNTPTSKAIIIRLEQS